MKKRGRKPFSKHRKKSVCISVAVTISDREALREYCEDNHTTVSRLLRSWISRVLDQTPDLF